MIISRTPFRISFCGGGSDLPSFYREHGGAVLSMSIYRHVYLSLHEKFESDGYILKYSEIETPALVDQIKHRIIKQVFKDYRISGVDLNSSADIPAGTGLGSSSAFTVGLVNLCAAYLGQYVPKAELARQACEIEIDKLGEPIGRQDQYGCALGGMNFIEFHPDDTVSSEVIALTEHQRTSLENSLTMFYLGGTRSASAILKEQNNQVRSNNKTVENLKAMVDQAKSLRAELRQDIGILGEYLHDGWERKKSLSPGITNSQIDQAYTNARNAGATGGKLLGAGGSGFLLVFTPENKKEDVRSALKEYQAYDVKMDSVGSTIIYAD